MIFGADESDDWTDPKVWKKANPSLGITVGIDKVKAACESARQNPAEENAFRQLRLNQWVKQSVRWMPMEKWDRCAFPVDEDELEGRICYGGLDLSSTTDITAFVLVFPPADEDDQLIPDREELIEGCRLIQRRLTDCGEIDEKLRAVYSEMEVLGEMVRQLVDENSRASQDQDGYQERYGGLNRRYSALQKKRSALETARTARVAKMEALDRYIAQLETRDGPLVHFDGRLWLESIDRATVYHDGRIVFRFIDGTEIPG